MNLKSFFKPVKFTVLFFTANLLSTATLADQTVTEPDTTNWIEEELIAANITNVALGKPTSQTSVAFDGNSQRAVDGTIDGNYAAGSVTHTTEQIAPWWEVNLLDDYAIRALNIWNRTDCCSDRLSNFIVEILDRNRAVVKTFSLNTIGSSVSLDAANITGRYVRVQLRGSNFLSLAEVQVFAD